MAHVLGPAQWTGLACAKLHVGLLRPRGSTGDQMAGLHRPSLSRKPHIFDTLALSWLNQGATARIALLVSLHLQNVYLLSREKPLVNTRKEEDLISRK